MISYAVFDKMSLNRKFNLTKIEMKKLLYLLVLASVVSCKKDNSQKAGSSLVANWSFISESTYQNGARISTNYFTSNFLTLNDDNTGSLTYNGKSSLLTYTVNDNTITFYLTSSSGNSTMTGTIKTLTSSELEIYRSDAAGGQSSLDDIYTK